jgi:hypothetical protein
MPQGIHLVSRTDKAAGLQDWANTLIAAPEHTVAITARAKSGYRVTTPTEAKTCRTTQEVLRFVKQYADGLRKAPTTPSIRTEPFHDS